MALKALMLRKTLDGLNAKLEAARKKSTELVTREAELEESINEAESDDEKAAVNEAVEEYDKEKAANEQEIKDLEAEVEATERELKDLEERQSAPALEPDVTKKIVENERGDLRIMSKRTKFFGMTIQERDAFINNDAVKGFLERVRTACKETRAVTGAELTIPDIVLDLIREKIEDYSKLIKYLNKQSVSGTARQTILGTIPEAVWTETIAKINELSFGFNQVDVDGNKVAGYIPVYDAIIEDSDINLAEVVITALGQAIGLALDKAILYGTGVKMPMGIVTRLAQTERPADYPAKARTWVDLHTSNIKTIAANKTGVDLFKELINASGAAKGKYSNGTRFWVMNETTYTTLISEALSINASGAIATGMQKVMPIIGGNIETLDFIPDNVIIGGFDDLYLLAERKGIVIKQSEHVMFLEDATVFKGTARYDGIPVIAEGFVAIGIKGTTPTAEMTFAEDTANKDDAEG